MNQPDHEALLREVYRDVTVCLGGVFAVHGQRVADEVIWDTARGLGGLFRRHLRRLSREVVSDSPDQARPHPAIVHLLAQLDEPPQLRT